MGSGEFSSVFHIELKCKKIELNIGMPYAIGDLPKHRNKAKVPLFQLNTK